MMSCALLSGASVTLMFLITLLEWDDTVLGCLKLPVSLLSLEHVLQQVHHVSLRLSIKWRLSHLRRQFFISKTMCLRHILWIFKATS